MNSVQLILTPLDKGDLLYCGSSLTTGAPLNKESVNSDIKILNVIQEGVPEECPIRQWDYINTHQDSSPYPVKHPTNKDLIINQKTTTYQEALFKYREPDKLIMLFMQQRSALKRSDAMKINFQMEKVYKRMRRGYPMTLFDFLTGKPELVKLSFDKHLLLIKKRRQTVKIPIKAISGVVMGAQSSTFRVFRNGGGKLSSHDLSGTDCFTVISKFSTYSFGCKSDKAKYDFFLVSSQLIHAFSQRASILPISKGNLSIVSVKRKLVEMANERSLFLNQLFILAMIKSCIQRNQLLRYQKLKQILKSKFSYTQKFFRLALKFRPHKFTPTAIFEEKFEQFLRVTIMGRKMAERLLQSEKKRKQKAHNWNSMRKNQGSLTSLNSIKKRLSVKQKKPRITEDFDINNRLVFKKILTSSYEEININ